MSETSFDFTPPEISVLMCCYNASYWMRDAIDSVLEQTFENFELILVDDGSTDDTWDVIQSYCERDNRIVAISKKNTGLTDSLNVGIAHAKGTWVARLDADDLCKPTRLEEQLGYLRSHPEVVLLGSGCIEIDEHGSVVKEHLLPSEHRDLMLHLERMRQFFSHSSAMFKREVVQQAGCYNVRFRKTQDWDLWLRLAECGRIACLDNALVLIRKHSAQISNSASGTPQLMYGIAASTCHFLRLGGSDDPSSDEDVWQGFMAWCEKRMEEDGILERRRVWIAARADFFALESRINGAFRFGMRLLQSGHASSLLQEKFFGCSLPKRLANEWVVQANR